MSKIGKLISNIHEYGNSKLYMKVEDPNANYALEFSVDNSGNLNVVGKREVFDKPYWNGSDFDDSAKMLISEETTQYSGDDLIMSIALVVYSTIYDNKSIIKRPEKSIDVNTDKAVNVIYQIANSMLELSNKDLTSWRTGGQKSIENMMIKKASERTISEDIKPAPELIDSIEEQVTDVSSRLDYVDKVWKEMDNDAEWDRLLEDGSKAVPKR